MAFSHDWRKNNAPENSDLLDRIFLRIDFVEQRMRDIAISSGGCWEYQGCRSPAGYGKFKIYVRDKDPSKKTFMAHRVSYAFHLGSDPGDMYVCHTCDNPSCINPNHLFLGTPKDNMVDMVNKGRNQRQDGEHNHAKKLSESTVIDIVDRIQSGKTNKAIAAELPVSHAQVSLIRLGKSWRALTSRLNYDPDKHRKFNRRNPK